MPRRSSLLEHPRRRAIDRLIKGREVPWTKIAADFEVSYDALRRYAVAKQAKAQPPPSASVMDPVETFRAAFGQEPPTTRSSTSRTRGRRSSSSRGSRG